MTPPEPSRAIDPPDAIEASDPGVSPTPHLARGAFTPIVIISLALAFALPGLLLLAQGHRHLAAGEAHLERGEIHEAIFRFGRGARAYVPMGPFHEGARSKLMGLGLAVEARGDDILALEAYDTLRRSILAGRWLMGPDAAELEAVNLALAGLYARLPGTSWPDPDLAEAEGESIALERLSQVAEPNRGLSLLGGLSLIGWIAAALGLIGRGFDAQGGLRPRPALTYGAGLLVCLALFFVSMGLA